MLKQKVILMYDNHITDKTPLERRFEIEEAIRHINLEPRINRIVLGKHLENAIKSKVKARMLRPLEGSNHSYVFMPLTDENWEDKKGELILRCDVARVENPTAKKIIGIAIGNNGNGESCFDVCYIHIPTVDNDFVKHVNKIKKELGYFKNSKISESNITNSN